jgi:hypothetical protein
LISSISTKIGMIFGSLEYQFWKLEQREKFPYRTKMLCDFVLQTVRSFTADCSREALGCVSHLQRSCATYPHHASHWAQSNHHLTHRPLPLFPTQKHFTLLLLSSPNKARKNPPSFTKSTTLAGVHRRTSGGRHWRASPPPRPSLLHWRPRRRPSPSFFFFFFFVFFFFFFFFFFTKPSRMNSTRSIPTALYSKKWHLARALLIAGELPSLLTFILVPPFKVTSPSMASHHRGPRAL